MCSYCCSTISASPWLVDVSGQWSFNDQLWTKYMLNKLVVYLESYQVPLITIRFKTFQGWVKIVWDNVPLARGNLFVLLTLIWVISARTTEECKIANRRDKMSYIDWRALWFIWMGSGLKTSLTIILLLSMSFYYTWDWWKTVESAGAQLIQPKGIFRNSLLFLKPALYIQSFISLWHTPVNDPNVNYEPRSCSVFMIIFVIHLYSVQL